MAINKVVFGNRTLIDLTAVTVTPEVLLDGYTAYDASGNLIVGTYGAKPTNQLPISTDTDGSVYNGIGYLEKARFNSSGSIVTYNTQYGDSLYEGVTGFIPAKTGDTLYFRNLYAPSSSGGFGGYEKYLLFDSSKTRLGIWQGSTHANIFSNVVTENMMVGSSSQPMIVQATINYANTAYIRMSVFGLSTDSIITVNQNPD